VIPFRQSLRLRHMAPLCTVYAGQQASATSCPRGPFSPRGCQTAPSSPERSHLVMSLPHHGIIEMRRMGYVVVNQGDSPSSSSPSLDCCHFLARTPPEAPLHGDLLKSNGEIDIHLSPFPPKKFQASVYISCVSCNNPPLMLMGSMPLRHLPNNLNTDPEPIRYDTFGLISVPFRKHALASNMSSPTCPGGGRGGSDLGGQQTVTASQRCMMITGNISRKSHQSLAENLIPLPIYRCMLR